MNADVRRAALVRLSPPITTGMTATSLNAAGKTRLDYTQRKGSDSTSESDSGMSDETSEKSSSDVEEDPVTDSESGWHADTEGDVE